MTQAPAGTRADVWLTDPAVCRQAPLRRAYEALLSGPEQVQHRRFFFEVDRDRYLLTRALVRCVLGEYTGAPPETLQFKTNAWGKPALQASAATARLAFNVSHTTGLVALVVTEGQPVGLDIEDTRRTAPLGVAHRFFSAHERAALAALPARLQPRRFWELWTLKESYVKALGMGLHQALDSFGFDLASADHGIAFSSPAGLPAGRWWLGSWQVSPHHLLALCLEAEDAQGPLLRVRRITPLVDRSDCTLTALRTTRARCAEAADGAGTAAPVPARLSRRACLPQATRPAPPAEPMT